MALIVTFKILNEMHAKMNIIVKTSCYISAVSLHWNCAKNI